MALPSSRRPADIDDSEVFGETKPQTLKLKLPIRRTELFFIEMSKWYKRLNWFRKERLQPIQLKRAALEVCENLGLAYDSLPLDWVAKLRKDCKLKLYRKKDKSAEHLLPKGLVYQPSTTRPLRSSARLSTERRAAFNVKATGGTDETDSKTVQPEVVNNEQKIEAVKKTTKKFIDYSNQAPPPPWLSAYAKGIILPRILCLYSTDDCNILYYDYSPELKDELGREITLNPEPRHGFGELFTAKKRRRKYYYL